MSLTKATYSMIEGAPANVLDFGAVGNGVADDTAAFNAAIIASKAVYIPAGTYIVDVVNLAANTFIFGDGAATILKQKSTFANDSRGSLYANSGSSSTTLDNITIRDLRIEGTNIVAPTFSEFKHLISLHGVRNVLIENVQVIGFQGDGVIFGSGVVGGDERHNYNVKVINCFFDGINRENRNGLSVIDGDSGIISGCTFQNCSKSTMPGAIDFEPDAYAFHIIKNWVVENNTFKAVGGNVGCIGMIIPSVVPIPVGFSFINNTFLNYAGTGSEIAITAGRAFSASDVSMDVLVDGNAGYNGRQPVNISSSKGVNITSSNRFQTYTTSSFLGFTGATDIARDITHMATYISVGTADTRGITVGRVNGLTLGGTLTSCATDTGSSFPIQFVSVTNNVTIEGLRITKRASQTVAINNDSATFTAAENRFINNDLDGLSSQFESISSDPTTVSLLASWTGTAGIDRVGNTVIVDFNISGGTQTNGTNLATIPAGYRPRSSFNGTFLSGTGAMNLRFDSDGAVFITPIAAPSTTIRGQVVFPLAV
jgi:hypothetical protein